MEMFKIFIVFVLIPSLLIQLSGCYSMKVISKNKLEGLKENGDLIVYTKDSKIYFFEEQDYRILHDSLYGKGYVKYNDDFDSDIIFDDAIALENIETIQRDELNPGQTTWLLIGGILLLSLIVLSVQFLAYASGI